MCVWQPILEFEAVQALNPHEVILWQTLSEAFWPAEAISRIGYQCLNSLDKGAYRLEERVLSAACYTQQLLGTLRSFAILAVNDQAQWLILAVSVEALLVLHPKRAHLLHNLILVYPKEMTYQHSLNCPFLPL